MKKAAREAEMKRRREFDSEAMVGSVFGYIPSEFSARISYFSAEEYRYAVHLLIAYYRPDIQ